MKFAANLSSLWTELPYLDRFEAAAAAGFDAVSVPLPYQLSAKDTQRAALRAALPVVQISSPPPNYTGGERGFAAVPGLEARFRYDLRRTLRYVAALRVPYLHIMAGVAEGEAARQTLLANLQYAVENIPAELCLTLQPQAQEGAYLSDFARAADIIETLGSPKLGLQYHSRHAQMLHGDAVAVFADYAGMIRLIQLGDAPGSGVPGTGNVKFGPLFDAIEKSDFRGWLVADYDSAARTEETLEWLPRVEA